MSQTHFNTPTSHAACRAPKKSLQWDETPVLVVRRELYREAAAHARKMLQEQGELPIVDAVRVDANHAVVETFSMTLLPIVPEEDGTRFVEYRCQLAAWHVELAAFWRQAHERSDRESQG